MYNLKLCVLARGRVQRKNSPQPSKAGGFLMRVREACTVRIPGVISSSVVAREHD
jgi:hypothetical protein